MAAETGSMRAIRHMPGEGALGRLVPCEVAKPVPGDGELLIRVHAAGINRADLKQRANDYPQLPAGASELLGLEVSGVVEACGAHVLRFRPGDRVCALLVGGGYAQYCSVPEAQCLPIPAGMDDLHAAGIPEAFATVWQTLFIKGALRSGERVLIHGGSGGIGSTAIQLASALGAQVFATAGSDDKCRFCESIGAVLAINYRRQDFRDEIMAYTKGQGVDVILDMQGAPYAASNLACLAMDGRLAYVAGDGGGQVSYAIRDLMLRRLTITGATLRHRSVETKRQILADLHRVAWPLLESGAVRVVVDRVFALEDAEQAHQYLDSGSAIGKVMLRVH